MSTCPVVLRAARSIHCAWSASGTSSWVSTMIALLCRRIAFSWRLSSARRGAAERARTQNSVFMAREAISGGLLPRDRRAAASQDELLDLAGRRLGQLVEERDALRRLEPG